MITRTSRSIAGPVRLLATAAALAVIVAACGDDGSETTTGSDGSATTAEATSTSTSEPIGSSLTTETSEASTSTTAADPAETSTTAADAEPADTGIVAVRLEETPGPFFEGFEIGLRFETGTGEPIAATLWTDYIQSLPEEPTIDTYYDTVLEQTVPAGQVVVLAEGAIGAGPPPVAPDVDGPLDCQLPVTVEAGGRVVVEFRFSAASGDCLAEVDG